jgi:hypothetical protein
VQTTGLPPAHTPARQLSLRVQALPSLHVVPSVTGGFEHTPVCVLHVPATWHWSCAVHTTGLPPWHAPTRQLSVRVQALASSHVVPSVAGGFEHVPVCVLHVPAT